MLGASLWLSSLHSSTHIERRRYHPYLLTDKRWTSLIVGELIGKTDCMAIR